jgi:transitional endoplasmic reticulum ATPase
VAETAARRTAAIAPDALTALGVAPGDPVRVTGRTVALARAAPDDAVAPGEVELDRATRRNAGVEAGDVATLAAVECPSAVRATFAPTTGLRVRGGGEAVRRALEGEPIAPGETVPVSLFGGTITLPFTLVEASPAGPVRVAGDTEVTVREGAAEPVDVAGRLPLTYDDVGGVDGAREALAPVERFLSDPERFESLGGVPVAGVLVVGTAGVGKTSLVRALVGETGASFVPVDPARVAGGSADAGDYLADRLATARRSAPAVLFVEDVPAAVPAEGDGDGRATVRFRRFLDRATDAVDVVVLGEARSADDVAASLRRGGRFDREVVVETPDAAGRREILSILTRGVDLAPDVDLAAVARDAHGFVGADLGTLCREAVGRAVAADRTRVVADDFAAALDAVDPGSTRGVTVTVPDVSFDDVGGLAAAKRELLRAVEWPLRHPDLFDEVGVSPSRGLLLYGPPGTGKTLLARATASESAANFISVRGPELMDKYVGESERAVREVFERARQAAPAVVFFDEVDAVSAERTDEGGARAPERVVSQLLTELDGVEPLSGVTVVGATNRPDRIDRALLRPGRLERVVRVPLPDREARASVFRVHARGMPVADLDFDALAARTEGYTGSDIEAVCREAGLLAVEERLAGDADGTATVTREQFERALESVRPSLTEDQRRYYDEVGERLRG